MFASKNSYSEFIAHISAVNTRLFESHNTCHLFPSQALDIKPIILVWGTICFMLYLARNTGYYVWTKWISFTWLCVSYCHFPMVQRYPRLLCKERTIISYSIAKETARLNLIIVWRRKYFQWRHLPMSIDFITDVISVCYLNVALSSYFKILILACCSNILLLQNTCCKNPWPSNFPVG